MQFYKIEGFLKGDGREQKSDERRASLEKAGRISLKTDLYYQKLQRKVYFFVSDLTGETFTGGVITREPQKPESQLADFFKEIGLETESFRMEEITLNVLVNMLQCANRNCFVEDEDEILEQFELDMLCYRPARCIEFVENMIGESEKENVYLQARKNPVEESLLPELDRIYAGRAEAGTGGHPVHYMVMTDDDDVRKETTQLLLEALYANQRVRGKRYCTLDIGPGDRFALSSYDCLYKSCTGGAVVVQYLANDSAENDYAAGDRDAIEVLCETAKKYCNKVLTVFCLPRECTDIRDFFYEDLGGMSIVELKEELACGDRAVRFLHMLAADHEVAPDDLLAAKVEPDKGYLVPELHDLFDDWYGNKLKTDIYPQYREIGTSRCEAMKAAPKGSAYSELMEMVGLNRAKKVIQKALNYQKAQKIFVEKGMKTDRPAMHMVFTGNPGTAKTSVARLFAAIMKENHILSKGRLVEAGRGDLVGKYVGWTAPNIQRKFKEAEGSVLFIDEAYSLVDDRDGSFGDEAISTIVQEMENHRNDVIVIFAGYPDEMEKFLRKNPGLRSRIAYHVPFDDYDVDELCAIADLIASKKGLQLTEDAHGKLRQIFAGAGNSKDFGNGRYVRNVIEKAEMAQATRLLGMDYDSVSSRDVATICAEDIELPETGVRGKKRIGFSYD